MGDTDKFNEFLGNYLSASNRAAQIVEKMKSTGDFQQRKALFEKLKKCDAERHKAIEGMESEMGHH